MNPTYPVSDHFDGEKFFNTVPVAPKSLWKVFQWQLTGDRKKWPNRVENQGKPQPQMAKSSESVVATFINHASYLLQFEKTNVIVDPLFADRASPFQFLGPKRVRAPGLALESLPAIHVVLVTHNHYDHMDIAALKKLADLFNPIYIVPLANKIYLENSGIKNVVELDWWQSHQTAELEIFLTPAQHWSARGVSDRFVALWGGFFIKTKLKSVFWAGDTGYGPHFKIIREKLGSPNLSFLPIGAYEPRWFMKDMHMDPFDAVEAHLDLETSLSVGMHYGTFQLTDEAIDDPLIKLDQAKHLKNLTDFITLKEGETRNFAL